MEKITNLSVDAGSFELRRILSTDRSEFVRVHRASEREFTTWMPARPPEESLDEYFDRHLECAESGLADGTGIRLVAVGPEGRILGFFALSQIYRGPFQNAFASWSVSTDCTGRGIGTTGVIALLDLAFAPEPRGLGLHRIQANVVSSNFSSIRVAEKAGFRHEGEARDYLRIAGSWKDHIMFAKLATEHRLRFLAGRSVAPASEESKGQSSR